MIVCDRKVITGHIGNQILTGLLTLIAVHHTYEMQYSQRVQEIMYFIQEKLLGHPLSTVGSVA